MAVKNPLSTKARTRIKKRVAKSYTGRSTTRKRAAEAARTGKKLSDIAGGGKKLKAGERAKGAKVLSKTKSGAALVRARKARSLARQAAKARHRAAWERGQKSAGKKIARPKGYLKKNQ